VPAPTPTPAPAPAPTPEPAAAAPTLLPALRLNANSPDFGVAQWPVGPGIGAATAGTTVSSIPCGLNLARITYHVHPHLRILLDGQPLQIPREIGIGGPRAPAPGCLYGIHTHDGSGVLHAEWETPRNFTLGQFFQIWGQPLSRTQVADLTNARIVFWVIDGTSISEWTGNPADIELRSNRNIVIQVGAQPATIQVFTYD
jgi:hypothetical protein